MGSRSLCPGGKTKDGLADEAIANGTSEHTRIFFIQNTVQHPSCSGSQGLFIQFICEKKELLGYILS